MRGFLIMQSAIRARRVIGLALAFAFVGGAAQAQTASVTNRDDRDHKITIVEGDVSKDHTLKPNQMLEGICPKGCVLRLNDSDDDEYQIEPTDIVSIEDGYLYYDNQDPDPEPEPEPKKK
jgi:hypothetical protein